MISVKSASKIEIEFLGERGNSILHFSIYIGKGK